MILTCWNRGGTTESGRRGGSPHAKHGRLAGGLLCGSTVVQEVMVMARPRRKTDVAGAVQVTLNAIDDLGGHKITFGRSKNEHYANCACGWRTGRSSLVRIVGDCVRHLQAAADELVPDPAVRWRKVGRHLFSAMNRAA